MSANHMPCHGTFECLEVCSHQWRLSRVFRVYQKLHSYLVWYMENMGTLGTLKHAFSVCVGVGRRGRGTAGTMSTRHQQGGPIRETLDLAPGELVEVRSIEEILTTLDHNRRNKGLRWMTGMRQYCGKRYRVHKRVERIMLETNGELRNMKNTVLLQGVMCDGAAFGGCDRSCFHFWREVWLKRVPEQQGTDEDVASEHSAPET